MNKKTVGSLLACLILFAISLIALPRPAICGQTAEQTSLNLYYTGSTFSVLEPCPS